MSNGAIRTVENFEPHFDTESQFFSNPFARTRPPSRERLVSPESTPEAEDPIAVGDTAENCGKGTSGTGWTDAQSVHTRSFASTQSRSAQPTTPKHEARVRRRPRPQEIQSQDSRFHAVSRLPLTPQLEQQETPMTKNVCRPPQLQGQSSCLLEQNEVQPLQDSVVPTPPTEGDESRPVPRPSARRHPSAVPSRLNIVDSLIGNDGSLPSPSLSPIHAANNMQHAGYFGDVDSNDEILDPAEHDTEQPTNSFEETPSVNREKVATRANRQRPTARPFSRDAANVSTDDIPAMLDFFEAIPDELKSYVMHQLLRRCPKPTLHIVADAVNPALKCDFLGTLPTELALNVVKFLDLQSMCRASQVSRRWRRLINTAEKDWKELFDCDGFTLTEEELQRSINEGWGWQDPTGANDFEKDLNSAFNLISVSESDRPNSASSGNILARNEVSAAAVRRPKRKATTKLSNRNKYVKRKTTTQDSPRLDDIDYMSQAAAMEGPHNAANAAALAVPYAQIGLASLKELHLFKSLYRRHYLIRKNWLKEEATPRHIAFRAHENHVVTCLQFDTDKILTGSDDNNINVYDTKTGAVRAKLNGHEGGVWALQYEGNILVSGSTDRSVRVWDIERGAETHVFRGHTSTVRCLQILMPTKTGEVIHGKAVVQPKVPLIITGSRDSNLRVWRLPQPGDPEYIQPETPTEDTDCPFFVRTLSGHQHSVRAIAAHADTLVSGSYDCSVRVWKISTGETVHRLQGHTQKVYSVVLDHARNRCISGSMDNLVKIWSLDTGSMLYTLDGHSSLVGLLDLNCERLVSAAADSTLRIWDPENGQCKATLSAHTGAITCFQHDAQKVISGSDRTLKMWNVKTGECIKDLLTDLSGVWQVKFNERRCVAAVQRDNMTYIEVSGEVPISPLMMQRAKTNFVFRYWTMALHEMA